MTTPEHAALRQLVTRVLFGRAGPNSDAAALATAVRRACDELARVLAPVIGRLGIEALAERAVNLAQQEYVWLEKMPDSEHSEELFSSLTFFLKQQDPAVGADAAAAVLGTFAALLIKMIGAPLATQLIRQAWPDGFPDAATEETGA
jgi:hypothetical protein